MTSTATGSLLGLHFHPLDHPSVQVDRCGLPDRTVGCCLYLRGKKISNWGGKRELLQREREEKEKKH